MLHFSRKWMNENMAWMYFLFDATSNFCCWVFKESSRTFSLWLWWCKFPEGASKVIHPPSLNHPSHKCFINSFIISTVSWGAVGAELAHQGNVLQEVSDAEYMLIMFAWAAQWWMLHNYTWYLTLNLLVKLPKCQGGLLGELHSC